VLPAVFLMLISHLLPHTCLPPLLSAFLCAVAQVAQAPRAAAPRVQAMAELDQGWLPSKAAADDIDLSLLTACLLPSEQVGRHAGTGCSWLRSSSRMLCKGLHGTAPA
jgi:hypothetical protein